MIRTSTIITQLTIPKRYVVSLPSKSPERLRRRFGGIKVLLHTKNHLLLLDYPLGQVACREGFICLDSAL